MRKSILAILCLLVLGTGTSCLKWPKTEPTPPPPRQLPPITTEGLNTFGCYVNDKLMLRMGVYQISFGYAHSMADSASMSFEVEDKELGYHLRIDMDERIGGVGKYSLGHAKSTQGGITGHLYTKLINTILQDRNAEGGTVWYRCNSDMYGELNILYYDIATQRMSGTFEFDAVFYEKFGGGNAADYDTVRVRQGRFDYKR
jgi:hypothetical protein